MLALRRQVRFRFAMPCATLACVLFAASSVAQDGSDKTNKGSPGSVLVTVNGTDITEGDLEFALLLRKVPAEEQSKARRQVLEQLVDRRLMQEFLTQRKATVDDAELKAQVERIHDFIKKSGGDPAVVLPKLGMTPERLKQELAVPLAWASHARRMVPDSQIRDYWKEHRSELDGTQVRAAHIVLKIDASADAATVRAAEETLKGVREEIVSGKTTFAKAAKKHSHGPSREMGGDVGFLPYRGKMPPAFSQAAFALKTGDVSEPVRTPFGVHLITVTERKAGDLNLEDVRDEVYQRVLQEQWDTILKDLRAKAKIEWRDAARKEG